MLSKNMKNVLEGFDAHYTKMSREGKFEPVQVYGGSIISSHSSLLRDSIGLFDQPYNTKDTQVCCSVSQCVAVCRSVSLCIALCRGVCSVS